MRRIICTVLVALGVMLSAARVPAHPFDGDGNGPAKEGSSNVQAYLYVEPFNCRVECLIWLPTALEWFGKPQGTDLLLPEQVKVELIEKARAEAGEWCTVRVNGVDQPLEINAATVLRGMPGRSDTLKPGEPVGVMDAMLGITWECSAPADIQNIELEWRKFTPQAPAIPVTVSYGPVFENGMVLDAAAPAGIWRNNGMLPPAKSLVPVPPVPEAAPLEVPLAGILWLGIAGGGAWLAGWLSPKAPRRLALALVALVLGAVALWLLPPLKVDAPWEKPQPVTVEQAQPVLQALLRNTYRAFEQRDESAVYDVLARSIHGDLLERIYVQTARALALEAQDGTRVKISDLAADVDEVAELTGRPGFVAKGQWTAFGRVGHWGHMHQRINKYKANMTVEPVEGAWKLTGLEVLEETRDFEKQPSAQ